MLKKPSPGDRGMVTAGLGQKPNAGIRHPSKLPLLMDDGRRIKIVAFRITTNTMVRNGRGRIQFFSLKVGVRHTPISRKKN